MRNGSSIVRRRPGRALASIAVISVSLVLVVAQRSPAATPPAELVSVLDTGGNQSYGPSISADGALVGFTSTFSIDNTTSSLAKVRDRAAKVTEAVPWPPQTQNSQDGAVLSRDGCQSVYVTTVDATDAAGAYQTPAVIAANRCAGGATNRLFVPARADLKHGPITDLAVSSRGGYVAFAWGPDLVRVERDANGNPVDVKTLTNHRASAPSLGDEHITGSVAFTGLFGASGGPPQVQLWDPSKAATDPTSLTLVSAQSGSTTVPVAGTARQPSMTPDGRFVAFAALVTDTTAVAVQVANPQVFVREVATSTTRLITAVAGGAPANGRSDLPSISADGTQIAFESTSTNLIAPPVKTTLTQAVGGYDLLVALSTSGLFDTVAFDRVSLKPNGAPVDPVLLTNSSPSISSNGRWVAFTSQLNSEYTTGGTSTPGGNTDTTSNVYVIGRPASLSIPPTDFGATAIGSTTAAKTITVTNTGISSVLPATITAANAQFKITGGTCQANAYISPGRTCTVTITFRPSAAGARNGTLTLAETGFAAITGTGPLTGTGTPPPTTLPATTVPATTTLPATTLPPVTTLPPLVGALTITPSPASFGTSPIGVAAAPITFTITSSGTADVPLTAVTITGADAGDFVTGDNACAGTLASGTACQLTVVFTPTANGKRTATLTVRSNKIKATSALDGRGVVKPALRLTPQAVPRGQNAVVIGINFPPGAAVGLRWSTGDQVYTATAAGDGTLFAQIPVLTGEILGPRTLSAVDQPGLFTGVSTPALVILPTLQPPVNNNPAFKGVTSIIIRG